MNLDRAKIICKNLNNHYCPKVLLTFEEMGFRTGGQTKWRPLYIGIRMNINFIIQKDEEEVINTMLHEIAHALDVQIRGTSAHDMIWRTIAKGIGCTGDRCYEGALETKGIQYVYTCPECGSEHIQNWKRGPKSVVACKACCNKYNHGEFTAKYARQLTNTFINK